MRLRFFVLLTFVVSSASAQSYITSFSIGAGYPIALGYNHLSRAYWPASSVFASLQFRCADQFKIGALYQYANFHNGLYDGDPFGLPLSTATTRLHSFDAVISRNFSGESKFQFNPVVGTGLSMISYDKKDSLVETHQRGINVILKSQFDYSLTKRLHSSLGIGYEFAYFFPARRETSFNDRHIQLLMPQVDLSYLF